MADATFPRPRPRLMAVLVLASGARAGLRVPLHTEFATLGRHPSSDVQLDPERDLEASARHAAVFRQGGEYVIRDLGSTNGTWVNGERVRGDRALERGDRIRLGARGPELEFIIAEVDAEPATPVAAGPVASFVAPTVETAPLARRPRPSKVIGQEQSHRSMELRAEVVRQTDRLRRRVFTLAAAVVLALGGGVALVAWQATRERDEVVAEHHGLLRRVDSLQARLADASVEAEGLEAALERAQRDAQDLRATITAGGRGPAGLAALDSQVMEAIRRHTPLLRAANFDAIAVAEANQRAILMVFAERGDGSRISATGFVAATRADTAWIITSRHALVDPAGRRPERVTVVFNGASTLYLARYLAVHDSADVGILRIVVGQVPQVKGIAADAAVTAGDAVATIGFPMGLDLPMGGDWRRVGVTATTLTGTISRVLPGLVQLDGYGATGASGSPVLNRDGRVVGVLFGSERDSAGRILYAAGARAVVELLRGQGVGE